MWRVIRASMRLFFFLLVSLLTVLTVAAGNILLRIFSHSWSVRWKNLIIRSWAATTSFILGVKISKQGTPPEPPFFLVSNHLSYLDVVPLWRYLDATFVAKSEIKGWPFFGWGTQTLGVLFIDRELKRDVQRMNQRISETISQDQGVILFPEGTSTEGTEVLPFNTSLLKYAAQHQMPVNFATIRYHTTDDQTKPSKHICWWGDMEFLPHFWELLKIPRFEAELTFGDYRVTQSDRKELAEMLHGAVARQFVPITDQSEPVNGK